MKLIEQESIERQHRVIELSGVPPSVVHAMDNWVSWMKSGGAGGGYPKASIGFSPCGANSTEDMEQAAASYSALAAHGAIKGLSEKARNCIYIVWLDMLICYATTDVDAEAADAMKYIWRGLSIRGAV